MKVSIRELLTEGQRELDRAGKENSGFDARALLSFVMGIPFGQIPLRYSDEVPEDRQEDFRELIGRRLSGEPLQYITGEQDFMGLTFHVDPRVLIPRLDTEILAEEAVEYIKKTIGGRPDGRTDQEKPFKVLDLCCGSGAIGLSIAKLVDDTGSANDTGIEMVLSDISEDALEVSKENADMLGLNDKVTLIQSDLFENIEDNDFDLIVSNPPYVKAGVIRGLDEEVRDHEPMLALDGGTDGLDVYRKIVEKAADYLGDGGCLMMEIGFDQAEVIKKLLEEDGRYTGIQIKKDLAGLDRVAVSKKQG